MKKQFEMTQAQYNKLLKTIKVARSTPLIMLQCGRPESPQEAANRAWCALGKEMGFDGMTVEPDHARRPLFFMADEAKS